jgi:chorismate dehydratase
MGLRVGIVDYLNSWPLAWGFLSGGVDGFEPSYHAPARVAELLAAGEIDVGLVPSIEVQRLAGARVVPGLCVASTHEVRSVLLVAKRPFEEVRTVALDENSRTSAALVRIVLGDLYGVDVEATTRAPRLEAMLATADAALIIGDPALAVDRCRYRILDLAAAWWRLTGRPFVFAVWAVRAGAPAAGVRPALEASLRLGLEQMDAVIERAVERLGLAPEVVERYLLRHLRYVLGAEELAGLEAFYARAHAHGLISAPRPLEFSC